MHKKSVQIGLQWRYIPIVFNCIETVEYTIYSFLVIKSANDYYSIALFWFGLVLVSFVIFYCVGFNSAFRRMCIAQYHDLLHCHQNRLLFDYACINITVYILRIFVNVFFSSLVCTCCFCIHSVSEKWARLKVSKTMSSFHAQHENDLAKLKLFGINKMLVITTTSIMTKEKK